MDTQALGRYLRETREAKELSLDDAMQNLRIRRGILEGFEQGDFSSAGSPVQVRGLLRNYARYLGLDEDRTLQYYDAALNDSPRRRWGRRKTEETAPVAPKRITDTPPSLPAVPITLADKRARRNRGWIGPLFTGIIGLAALGVIIFVVWNMLSNMSVELEPTITPEAVIAGAPTATSTPPLTRIPDTPIMTPTSLPLPPQIGGGVTVLVEFTQRSFLVVSADGKQLYSGIAGPGYFQQIDAQQTVDIKAANAIGLKLTVNGLVRDGFGARGQEVVLQITPKGIEVLEQSPLETPVGEATATVETPIAIAPSEAVETVNTSDSTGPTLTPFPLPGAATEVPVEASATETAQSVDNVEAADVTVSDTAQVVTSEPPTEIPSPEPSATPFVPTLTPLPIIPPTATTTFPTAAPAASSTLAASESSATTNTTQAQNTTTSTATPTLTITATTAANATATPVLPMRVTQSGLPPTKEGQ